MKYHVSDIHSKLGSTPKGQRRESWSLSSPDESVPDSALDVRVSLGTSVVWGSTYADLGDR